VTVPAAPVSTDGARVFFLVYDVSGTNTAALLQSYFTTTVNSEKYGHMGVYVISGTPKTGYKTTAGSTEIAISSSSVPCDGAVVMASPDNSEDVWVGPTGITTTKATTDGFRLQPGQSVGVSCRNLNTVFIRRGGSVDQAVYFSAQGAS